MRAASATPEIRPHLPFPALDAVEVFTRYRGLTIAAHCLVPDERPEFVVGSDEGVHAPAPENELESGAHSLLRLERDALYVTLAPRMTGTVVYDDGAATEKLAAGAQWLVPSPRSELQIACGDVEFVVRSTTAPPTLSRPSMVRKRDHLSLLAAAAGLLVVLTLLAFVPRDSRALSFDTVWTARRFLRTTVIPAALLPAPAAGLTLPAARGAEPKQPARQPISRRPMPRESAPVNVTSQGILGILASARVRASGIFATGEALGDDDQEVLNGLTTGDLSGPGAGGLDSVGSGVGSRGGLRGIGGLGTCSTQGNCEAGVGRADVIKLARKTARGPEVIPGVDSVRGSLDRDIVRRTIRHHLNEVKYCYETQLVRRPSLAGRVSVQFAIGPNGLVASAVVQSSTLDDITVESCVVQAVRRWDFPRPLGGGVVVVSYPFVMVPAGG